MKTIFYVDNVLQKLQKKKKMEIHLPEAYLQPSRTFTMELFCENSERLKADNYFRKIAPS